MIFIPLHIAAGLERDLIVLTVAPESVHELRDDRWPGPLYEHPTGDVIAASAVRQGAPQQHQSHRGDAPARGRHASDGQRVPRHAAPGRHAL